MSARSTFFGWRVMWAAFAVAVLGWGIGFYGPPVFLFSLQQTHGWSVGLLSAAVTTHYLFGALFVANMPRLYARFGLVVVTKASAVCLAVGVLGWACAQAPWQLFAVALISGIGWAGTGAMAINTIVAPWFRRRRPLALSMAYNGASVGGVVFSPLWVALIDIMGFPLAAAAVGAVAIAVLWVLAERVFSLTPQRLGTCPDGDSQPEAPRADSDPEPRLAGKALWLNRGFITYSAGFTLGLFVQVGIIAHLVSLLAPALGAQGAGWAAGFATACAIAGRLLIGWLLPPRADRRRVAAITYLVQALGCVALVIAGDQSIAWLLLGVALFGLGIGNVTSLPPLIAHAEFPEPDVARAIALATAIAQAAYAFAPAVFGLIRTLSPEQSGAFFISAAALQTVAAGIYLAGRRSA